jgi:uncharacterized DUF497 family protein
MEFKWNEEKNNFLKRERNISFEEVVGYIKKGCVVDDKKHINFEKYPNQRIMFLDINDYIYEIPYVVDKEKGCFFLKTMIPSRKYTKLLIKKGVIDDKKI